MRYAFLMVALLLSLMVSPATAQTQTQYPNGYYGQPQGWRGVLSPHDQQQFDKFYSKWVDATRKNDQDDIAGNAQHMQEIMARYSIPTNVSFDQVASNAVPSAYPPYPNEAYPANTQTRLSPDDQRSFDRYYSKWVESQRKNDQDDVDSNARKMQEIMARNNIPPNIPFAAIATNGYAAGPNGIYPSTYAYGQPSQHLSDKDQRDFNKYYRHWMDAKRKKDVDDIDKNARKMQDIMARYNIPANVPFDRIASPGETYR